jgi:hypothetical protein
MMKTEGIIIRTQDYGESNKIITVLTQEYGKISLMARGARKMKSRLSSVVQLFTYGQFLFFKGSAKSMGSLSQGEVLHSFRDLRQDLTKTAYAAYCAEWMDKVLTPDEPSGYAVQLLLQTFEYLAEDKNASVLARLFDEGRINLERAELLGEAPPAIRRDDLADRVEGMLLGLAIGDALGNTSEGMTPQMRGMTHGEIRDYLPNRRARHQPVGLPSDDTQLAFRTLEQMLEDGRVLPERLAERFVGEPILGIGGTVAAFVHNYKDLGKPWYEAGLESAGNGALMRIAPVLLPYLKEPSPELWADTALAAMLTHNDAAALRTTDESQAVAVANWWGHATGPAHPTNPSGEGDVIVGDARFAPWCLDEGCTELSPGELTVAPEQVTFDPVAIGQTGTTTIVLTHDGEDAGDLDVLSASVEGAGAEAFTVDLDTPASIAGGQALAVGVGFTPDEATSYEAVLVLEHSGLGGSAQVALTGEGLRPGELTVDPHVLDFGQV